LRRCDLLHQLGHKKGVEPRQLRQAASRTIALITGEASMSTLLKIAFIIAVATLAIAATRLIPLETSGTHALTGAAISPHDMMRAAGPLPETKVDHYQ
jgi:hypothetical protein